MGLVLAVLAAVVLLLFAWFVSEFQPRAWPRALLGACALSASYGVFYIAAGLERLNYNAWYGAASLELLNAEIDALKAGKPELVEAELTRLRAQYHPNYENKANYDDLTAEAAKRIYAEISERPASN